MNRVTIEMSFLNVIRIALMLTDHIAMNSQEFLAQIIEVQSKTILPQLSL